MINIFCSPFLQFHPVSGSFVAHPPFCEELMEATVDHIDRCLFNSTDPLSFIVFLPDWRDSPSKAVAKIEASRFKRKHITLTAFEHDFRHGFQHLCNDSEMIFKSSHPTLVIFLQNDAGFIRWGPTPDRFEALLESLKPGKETVVSPAKERELSILSPPPTPQGSNSSSQSMAIPSSNNSNSGSNHVSEPAASTSAKVL